MKAKPIILLLTAIFGLTACSVDSNPVVNPEYEGTDGTEVFGQEEPEYSSVSIDAPVFLSSSIKAEVKEGLQAFLTNITSLGSWLLHEAVRPLVGFGRPV